MTDAPEIRILLVLTLKDMNYHTASSTVCFSFAGGGGGVRVFCKDLVLSKLIFIYRAFHNVLRDYGHNKKTKGPTLMELKRMESIAS
jgi:hypothetical protein